MLVVIDPAELALDHEQPRHNGLLLERHAPTLPPLLLGLPGVSPLAFHTLPLQGNSLYAHLFVSL